LRLTIGCRHKLVTHTHTHTHTHTYIYAFYLKYTRYLGYYITKTLWSIQVMQIAMEMARETSPGTDFHSIFRAVKEKPIHWNATTERYQSI
jgi:hypothetical protein